MNIIFLGLVSFFIDLSTHMVYPLVPLYLVAAFGASPALIGTIEGIAESAASLLKVFSGYATDRFKKKKALAFAGYVPAVIYKLVLIFAVTWVGVLAARVIDRVGKGIRTSPRDVLIAESSDKKKMGGSFGLHKTLDMLGVALGILITYFVILNMGDAPDFQPIFVISIVPSVLGLFMFIFIKEKKRQNVEKTSQSMEPKSKDSKSKDSKSNESKSKEPFWKNAGKIDSQLKLYLFVVFLFTLGNSSNVFILLRAQSIGISAANVILLYFIYSMTASILSMPLGRLSDRIGRKNLLVPGYLTFSICYLGFAFVTNQWAMVAVFVAFGIYTAMISGVERAYVSEIAPPELKGTMLGLQATTAGIALLPASVIAGVMWDAFGPAVPFIFGASLSFVAAVVLIVFMKN